MRVMIEYSADEAVKKVFNLFYVEKRFTLCAENAFDLWNSKWLAEKVLDQTENIEERSARKSARHQARNQESVASY